MTAAAKLFDRCRALGITLAPGPAGALAWEADADPPADLLSGLARHKADLLALLAGPDLSPWGLPMSWYADWVELVLAIRDEGVPLERAEARAFAAILKRMRWDGLNPAT